MTIPYERRRDEEQHSPEEDLILTGLTCGALWLQISQKQFVKQFPERFV